MQGETELLTSVCAVGKIDHQTPTVTTAPSARKGKKRQPSVIKKNIARGTTDPEIDSETWTKLGNNMAPLALIANLATRWRHLTFSHLFTFSH